MINYNQLQQQPVDLKREYIQLTDDHRESLIQLMLTGDIALTEASRMLHIKYESAKTIWTLFRKKRRVFKEKQGRKSFKDKQEAYTGGNPHLTRFDEASDKLKQKALFKKFTTGQMQTAHRF